MLARVTTYQRSEQSGNGPHLPSKDLALTQGTLRSLRFTHEPETLGASDEHNKLWAQ